MTHELRIEVSDESNPSSGTDENGQHPIALIRKRLSPDEVYASNLRYDEETDAVQMTTDGGETWFDAPTSDPRNMTLFPPLTGSDVPCRSAASVVRFIQDTMSSMVSAGSAAEAATAIATGLIALLAALGPFSIMFALALVIVFAFIDLTWVVIEAALTSTVYDQLLCILYCHMDASGQVDAARLAAINADIDASIDSTAASVLHLMLQIMGIGGINNAAAKALDTDDCGDCGCRWCYKFDMTTSDGGWVADVHLGGAQNPTFGTHDASGWNGQLKQYNNTDYMGELWIRIAIPANCNVQSIAWTYSKVNGTYQLTMVDNVLELTALNPVAVSQTLNNVNSNTVAAGTNAARSIAGSWNLIAGRYLAFQARYNRDIATPYPVSGSYILHDITLSGTGDNPFGEDNC